MNKWNASKRLNAILKTLRRLGWVVDSRGKTDGALRIWLRGNEKHPLRLGTKTTQDYQEEIIQALNDIDLPGKKGPPNVFWIRADDWHIDMQNPDTGFLCITCIRHTYAGQMVRIGYDA